MLNDHFPYFLGCPAWADPAWKGRFFPKDQPALSAYAKVFNTVEGNTSFYQIPSASSVASWKEMVSGTGFRFSFKLPRSVTHEAYPNHKDLVQFLNVIEPLFDNLGPFSIQLPERVGLQQLDWMRGLLQQLPHNFQHVLEVRHPQFSAQPELLAPVLDEFNLGRVVMDTRSLFGGDPNHPEAQDALKKKPQLPIFKQVYHQLFYLRLILHPDPSNHPPVMQEWAQHVAQCLQRGDACFLMIHCANNLYAPGLAAQFHDLVRAELADGLLPALPSWEVPSQVGLF